MSRRMSKMRSTVSHGPMDNQTAKASRKSRGISGGTVSGESTMSAEVDALVRLVLTLLAERPPLQECRLLRDQLAQLERAKYRSVDRLHTAMSEVNPHRLSGISNTLRRAAGQMNHQMPRPQYAGE